MSIDSELDIYIGNILQAAISSLQDIVVNVNSNEMTGSDEAEDLTYGTKITSSSMLALASFMSKDESLDRDGQIGDGQIGDGQIGDGQIGDGQIIPEDQPEGNTS